MVKDGTLTADDIGTGAVKNDELDGNAVTSDKIANGAVKNDELDGNAVTGDKIANGTIRGEDVGTGANGLTGANVADGSLTGADLAAGSVSTDKQTANVASSLLPSTAQLVVQAATPTAGDTNASTQVTLINSDSVAHKALVTGQAQFTCTNCLSNETLNVGVQAFEGSASLTGEVTGQLGATPTATLPITALVLVGPGVHAYTLHLKASSTAVAADRTVTVDNPSLIAADLGR